MVIERIVVIALGKQFFLNFTQALYVTIINAPDDKFIKSYFS